MHILSWNPSSATEAHRAAHPGLDVLGVLQGSLPVEILDLEVQMLELRPWNVMQQFVARLITEVGGIRGEDELAHALGFSSGAFVRQDLLDLESEGFLTRDASSAVLHATPALRSAVAEGALPKLNVLRVSALQDPSTGALYPLMDSERQELIAADSAVPSPHPATLSEVERSRLRTWLASSDGPLPGASVHSLRDLARSSSVRVACEVVVIIDPANGQWGWEMFRVGHELPVTLWRTSCEEGGIEEAARLLVEARLAETSLLGSGPLPIENEESDESPAPHEALKASLPAEVASSLNILGTQQAAERLRELIDGAHSEILLFAPWIKSSAVQGLLPYIKRALRRDVAVWIGYGIAEDPNSEDSHSQAIDALREASRGTDKGFVRVLWLGHSHVKECIFDRKVLFTGSFNFLSYRGDPDRKTGKIRNELMVELPFAEQAALRARELTGLFRDALCAHGAPEGHQPPSSPSAWRGAWRPYLELGCGSSLLTRALREYPQSDPQLSLPLGYACRGLEFFTSADAAQRVSAIEEWLLQRFASLQRFDPRIRAREVKQLAEFASSPNQHASPLQATLRRLLEGS